MSGYVWLSITSFKVMNIPVLLPLARLNEQIHCLRKGFDPSTSLAWLLPLDVIFYVCSKQGRHPAETHAHNFADTHKLKCHQRTCNWLHSITPFETVCPSFSPSHTQAETQGQWRSCGTLMNGCEGCHPGQTEPGPTCCYILKNKPVTPTAEGNSLEVSHVLSIAHSVSFPVHRKWKITLLHKCDACNYIDRPIRDKISSPDWY